VPKATMSVILRCFYRINSFTLSALIYKPHKIRK